jgi:hypothetical protein
MPYFHMKEIWTPLKLIGIRFFIETESGNIYIKFFRDIARDGYKKTKRANSK